MVRTILVYGCEAWPLRVENQRRLEVFDNDCLRRILGRRRLDRSPCAVLRRQLHLRVLPPVSIQRRLCWFGHAPDDCWAFPVPNVIRKPTLKS